MTIRFDEGLPVYRRDLPKRITKAQLDAVVHAFGRANGCAVDIDWNNAGFGAIYEVEAGTYALMRRFTPHYLSRENLYVWTLGWLAAWHQFKEEQRTDE